MWNTHGSVVLLVSILIIITPLGFFDA